MRTRLRVRVRNRPGPAATPRHSDPFSRMKNLLPLLFLLGLLPAPPFTALAQRHTLHGKVKMGSDTTALPGATVVLQRTPGVAGEDTTFAGTATDPQGAFRFEAVAPGQYTLRVTYLGFTPYTRAVTVRQPVVDLGTILLREAATALQEIRVIGQVPTGAQKGDTAQFNADAFKTTRDANAGELVQKMPGIVVQDGKLQAQGEAVQQILVDGKPFFGNDVQTALENLPAEVITQVQVFDRKSDQAELSGFDDGQRIKTINIVTRRNRRTGQFGRMTAGYGTRERYLLGASVNLFRDNRRVTVTGLSNNINTLNFRADPGGQEGDRPQDGTIITHSLGLNYSEKWGKKMEASGSYFYTRRNNQIARTRQRDYALAADSGQVYRENSRSLDDDATHRLDARIDYKPSGRNRLLLTPSLSVDKAIDEDAFSGRTVTGSGPLNGTATQSNANHLGYNFRNTLLYNHRFNDRGRGVTLRLHSALGNASGNGYQRAENRFYQGTDTATVLNQYLRSAGSGFAWEGEISYQEPLGKRSRLEVEYEIGNRQNNADRRTFDFAEPTEGYTGLNPLLSNTFESNYLTQEAEAGYQFDSEKLHLELEGQYQHATLRNDGVFPRPLVLTRTFTSVLPSLEVDYKFSSSRSFHFDYRPSTTAPTVQQLQDVIDNSNPLHLRTGNPDLAQAYQHWMRARYRTHRPETGAALFAMLQGSFARNYISSSTLVATRPIGLSEEIVLQQGSQLTRPVNLNGYYNLHSYVSYGRPINPIKTNVNVDGSVEYTNRPGVINDEVNTVRTGNFRVGVTLSSNLGEKLDFILSSRSGYSLVSNSLRPALDNNFFNQTTRLKLDWIAWQGFVLRTELFHRVNAGLAAGFDNNYLLWNASLGKKLFRNQRGEISLVAFDLLGQNNSIRRNVTELYVEDVQATVLQRYFMLTFTYNLRHFTGGADQRDFEDKP